MPLAPESPVDLRQSGRLHAATRSLGFTRAIVRLLTALGCFCQRGRSTCRGVLPSSPCGFGGHASGSSRPSCATVTLVMKRRAEADHSIALAYTPRHEFDGATPVHARIGGDPAGAHRSRAGAGGVEPVPGGLGRRRISAARRRPDGTTWQRQDRAAQLVQGCLRRPQAGRGGPDAGRDPQPGCPDRHAVATDLEVEAACPAGAPPARRCTGSATSGARRASYRPSPGAPASPR